MRLRYCSMLARRSPMRSIFFSLLNASVSGLLSEIVEASAYYSFVMMTLDRGSFSSLRDVRQAGYDVSGFDVTCSAGGYLLAPLLLQFEQGDPLSQRTFLCLQASHCGFHC